MAIQLPTQRLGDTIHLYSVWKHTQLPRPFKIYRPYAFLFEDCEPDEQTWWNIPGFRGPENGWHIRDTMGRLLKVNTALLRRPLWTRPTPGNYVAICPNASTPDREWFSSYWRDLRNRLDQEGIAYRWCPMQGRDADVNQTLEELTDILSHARAVITVDSGPVHLADAFDVPVVGLYGTTSTLSYGPYQARQFCVDMHARYWDKNLPYASAAYNHNRKAMTSITVNMVVEKLKLALARR